MDEGEDTCSSRCSSVSSTDSLELPREVNKRKCHDVYEYNDDEDNYDTFTPLPSKRRHSMSNKSKSVVLWHNRPMTHITCLFPEILSTIFSYLQVSDKGRVAQVCRSWKEAAYNKSVWKGVEAKLHLRKMSSSNLHCTLHNCKDIVNNNCAPVNISSNCSSELCCASKFNEQSTLFSSLVDRGIKKIQILSINRSLKDVTENISNIESLVLKGCFSLRDDMCILNCNLDNLIKLDLSMCKRITDVTITRFSHNLVNLQFLDLSGCCQLTNISLNAIECNLKKLKHLNLSNCRSITDAGIARICGQFTSSSGKSVSKRHHDIPSNDTIDNSDTDKVKHENARGLQCLEYLGLSACQRLTDESLKHISMGLRNLKSLNISCCSSFTEFGLKYLATPGYTGSSGNAVSQCANINFAMNVTDINLRQCDNVSDLALKYLAEGNILIKTLDISFCDKITDQGLQYISQGLNRIQSLSLNSCNITDHGLVKLSETLSDLKVLNIGQCSAITDEGLNAIINNCPLVTSADIYGCPRITTPTIEALVNRSVTLSCRLWPEQVTVINRDGKVVDSFKSLPFDTNLNEISCKISHHHTQRNHLSTGVLSTNNNCLNFGIREANGSLESADAGKSLRHHRRHHHHHHHRHRSPPVEKARSSSSGQHFKSRDCDRHHQLTQQVNYAPSIMNMNYQQQQQQGSSRSSKQSNRKGKSNENCASLGNVSDNLLYSDGQSTEVTTGTIGAPSYIQTPSVSIAPWTSKAATSSVYSDCLSHNSFQLNQCTSSSVSKTNCKRGESSHSEDGQGSSCVSKQIASTSSASEKCQVSSAPIVTSASLVNHYHQQLINSSLAAVFSGHGSLGHHLAVNNVLSTSSSGTSIVPSSITLGHMNNNSYESLLYKYTSGHLQSLPFHSSVFVDDA